MLWLTALFSVSLISIVSLLGVLAIRVNKQTLDNVKFYLISLATGAMLGNAFVHLLPEAFEHASSPSSVWMPLLGGFLGCFLLQKVLRLQCHHGTGGHCAGAHTEGSHLGHIHPTGWMSIISHGMDNFTDGALIGAAYLVNYQVGIATTAAIILHEIPMELSGFGIMLNAGFRRWTAIGINFASGLVAMVGTVLTLWLGSSIDGFSAILTPVACGTVIYIVCAGLIPQLHEETDRKRSFKQLTMMVVGLGLMILAAGFHGSHGHKHDAAPHNAQGQKDGADAHYGQGHTHDAHDGHGHKH
jgi:zinc and cadmium transporter